MKHIIHILILSCLCAAAATAQETNTAPAASTKSIEVLIQQLGAPSFKQRKKAHAQLARLGEQAYPYLVKHENSDDPEIKDRIAKLMRNMGGSRYSGTWRSIRLPTELLVVNKDGTWHCLSARGHRTQFGKWFIRDNSIVWLYGHNTTDEDINPIIKHTDNLLRIREMDGSITSLTRVKD